MKAFIICGGEGTRLRPYTYSTPKPMLNVGEKPIMLFVLENLKKHGVTDIVLATGYLKEQIEAYFKDGGNFGLNIEYEREEKPKNTAGSIMHYKNKLNSTFIVSMGDHITDIDLTEMLRQHKKSGRIATIALKKHKTKIEFGVVEINKEKIVEKFVEKPTIENLINTAIYIFEPKIFDYIKEGDDFAKNVFPRLLENGQDINSYVFEEEWFDIGRVNDYEKLKDIKSPTIAKIAQLMKE